MGDEEPPRKENILKEYRMMVSVFFSEKNSFLRTVLELLNTTVLNKCLYPTGKRREIGRGIKWKKNLGRRKTGEKR